MFRLNTHRDEWDSVSHNRTKRQASELLSSDLFIKNINILVIILYVFITKRVEDLHNLSPLIFCDHRFKKYTIATPTGINKAISPIMPCSINVAANTPTTTIKDIKNLVIPLPPFAL